MVRRVKLKRPIYEVGYKKPPRHSQFKPGQSGNPKGRPKRTKNLKTDLREDISETVSVIENGSSRVVSKQRAIVKRTVAKALGGDARATEQIIKLIIMHFSSEEGEQDLVELLAEDTAILDRFFNEKRPAKHNNTASRRTTRRGK